MAVQEAKAEDDAQTKFYTQHMKRHLPPTMADRPSARAFDENLGKQVSESFRERMFASEDYSQKDSEIDSKSGKSLAIMVGISFLFIVVVGIMRHNDDKQFEKMVKENKEKKKSS